MPHLLPRQRAVLTLAAGFIVLFIGGGARFAIGLNLKPMIEEFGWARSDLGGAVALFQIVSALCMFFAGRAADRLSLRVLLGGAVALAGASIALMSLVSKPWHALVLYGLFFAIGNGVASTPPVSVMTTRAWPAHAGFANSVASSGMSLGQLVIVAALAAVLVAIGWRSVFVWVGLAHLLAIPFIVAFTPGAPSRSGELVPPSAGHSLSEATRTRQFWLLIGVYAVCGFDDFFVSTHVVAFAIDRGVDAYLAGNLLALMGLTALVGVLAAGYSGDRSGPVLATALSFAARVAVFLLVTLDQSPLSVAIFALVFGSTFLVTAPLSVLFVRESFGAKNLGAITGLITMVHHICGGLGAYLGAAVFDETGRYNAAFIVMLIASLAALAFTLALRRPDRPRAAGRGASSTQTESAAP